MSVPVFNGTPDQQALAEEVFRIMKAQGRFFAPQAPLTQTLSGLVEFLSQKYQRESTALASEIDMALRENEQVFRREERENEIVYITSRTGTYIPRDVDTRHMLKQRFYEPENPLPLDDISVVVSTSRPALTSVEPVFVSDYWQEQVAQAPAAKYAVIPESQQGDSGEMGEAGEDGVSTTSVVVLDEEQLEHPADAPLPDSSLPEGAFVGEPAETLAEQDETTAPSPLEGLHVQDEEEAEEGVALSTASWPAEEAAAGEQDALPVAEGVIPGEARGVVDDAEVSPVLDTDELLPSQTGPETGIEEVPLVEPAIVPPEPEPEPELLFSLPNGQVINIARPADTLIEQHGDVLESLLADALDKDPLRRIVHFGRWYYPESGLVSMGKNDLRRIREYILEVGEPLADVVILADIYYRNPRSADYEGFRFSLNYRLSREKDFDFVGVEGANLWSTKGLSLIGTKRVKASEMGQITAYLESEAFDDSLEMQSAEAIRQTGAITRILTFFEWQYGVLPLEASLRTLLPAPALPDQRSAILRIESPQHYTSFLVEVRYPTGNRGGWIQGFDDFFHEHLVAGALITLERTDEPNVYTIAYEETSLNTDRLLTLDEKKNRHIFADASYSCEVDGDMLINQQNFGRAKNLKSLPMSERRKADVVLEHVFETMGEQVGTREEPVYQILLNDLHTAYNILRPISLPYLVSLLEEHADCSVDETMPELYFYKSEPEPMEEDVEEEEEEEEKEVRLARQWGYDYDDE